MIKVAKDIEERQPLRQMFCRKCERAITIWWAWKLHYRSSWGWWVCPTCAADDWQEVVKKRGGRRYLH